MSRTAWIVVAIAALILILACVIACVVFGAVFVYRGAAVTDGVLVPAQFATSVRETVVSEIAIGTPATVEVFNTAGNVTIRAGEADDVVAVEATKEARAVFDREGARLLQEVQVLVDGNGSRATIRVTGVEGIGLGTVSVNLDITVPQETDLIIINEAGNVLVQGTEGSIRVRNDAGNTRLEDVTVTEFIDVQTSAGNIDCEARVPRRPQWEVALRTQVGNVSLAVPEDSAFTLDAETEVGSVVSGFELEELQTGGTVGQWLRGGANMTPVSPNVTLRSAAGNIRIEPLP